MKRVNLTMAYRLPSGNIKAAVDTLADCVSVIRGSTSGHTMVIGDFNIDLLNLNAHTRRLEQIANLCNITQLVKGPTRITHKSETTLDHLYTNAPHVALVGTISSNISDHLPIFAVLKKSRCASQFKEVYGRT